MVAKVHAAYWFMGMPHVALHQNRNTFQGSWEITAEPPDIETILS